MCVCVCVRTCVFILPGDFQLQFDGSQLSDVHQHQLRLCHEEVRARTRHHANQQPTQTLRLRHLAGEMWQVRELHTCPDTLYTSIKSTNSKYKCIRVCLWPWSQSCGVCAGGRPSPLHPRTACRLTRSSLWSSIAGGPAALSPGHVTSSRHDITNHQTSVCLHVRASRTICSSSWFSSWNRGAHLVLVSRAEPSEANQTWKW